MPMNYRGTQYDVVPYVGTWIEIPTRCPLIFTATRRSLRGNVDRNTYELDGITEFYGRSLRGNVDRNVAVGRR